mmetsp:Transcript_31346/g.121056  ORF Transcript_31346/g.121056 Transcript_31346/m.121056 type:complete len:115 (-) Transcript_31346:1950-2294(-)
MFPEGVYTNNHPLEVFDPKGEKKARRPLRLSRRGKDDDEALARIGNIFCLAPETTGYLFTNLPVNNTGSEFHLLCGLTNSSRSTEETTSCARLLTTIPLRGGRMRSGNSLISPP